MIFWTDWEVDGEEVGDPLDVGGWEEHGASFGQFLPRPLQVQDVAEDMSGGARGMRRFRPDVGDEPGAVGGDVGAQNEEVDAGSTLG